MNETSIAGYRPRAEPKPDKIYSTKYLQQDARAANLGRELYREVWNNPESVPCTKDPEFFTGDDLPTDREAEMACAPCPLREMCREYASASRPAHGVFGGRVYGRALKEEMERE